MTFLKSLANPNNRLLSSHLSPLVSPPGFHITKQDSMSRTGGGNSKLDLQLNLSQASRVTGNPRRRESPGRSSLSISPPTSCLSSDEGGRNSGSPEATSMMLVGCPRCLMYVMLSEEDPRCPKCKSTVLLDVGNQRPASTAAATGKRKGKKNN